jgi:hypothetical protein
MANDKVGGPSGGGNRLNVTLHPQVAGTRQTEQELAAIAVAVHQLRPGEVISLHVRQAEAFGRSGTVDLRSLEDFVSSDLIRSVLAQPAIRSVRENLRG